MKVVAVYNIKGGVGKTATAVNLGYLAAEQGLRTLVWDLDPQGAASFYFRVKAKVRGGGRKLFLGKRNAEDSIRGTDYDMLDLLPADFTYRHMDLFLERARKPEKQLARLLKPLRKRYDYLILDCAPSISLASESVFRASDVLLVPTIPTTLSLRTLEQLRKHLREMDRKKRPLLLPFYCMVDLRKSMHREIVDRANGHSTGFLRTRVPYSASVEKMGLHRAPLEAFAPRSAGAAVYRRLWAEVRHSIEGTPFDDAGADSSAAGSARGVA